MRYDGAVNEIKKLIASGKLGEVYAVQCSFRKFRSIPGIGGEFTNKAHAGGGVLNDWGVHFFDLVLYCLNNPELITASCEAYSKLGVDIDNYISAGNDYGKDSSKKDGVYDVEEYVTGLVRTAGPSISFTGCWAQNINKDEMYIDFVGTKSGIRLAYFEDFEWFTVTDNRKLVTLKPSFPNVDRFLEEHKAFADDVIHGSKSRAYIGNVLPTAMLLDALYKSADRNKEYVFSDCRLEKVEAAAANAEAIVPLEEFSLEDILPKKAKAAAKPKAAPAKAKAAPKAKEATPKAKATAAKAKAAPAKKAVKDDEDQFSDAALSATLANVLSDLGDDL
jgi:hypothetical protein